VIAIQFVLTLGLSYIIATVNVIFRDTEHIVNVLVRLLFFLTPIFYEASSVPERYQTLYRLNPMVILIEAYRALLIHGTSPEWLSLLALGVLAIVLLGVGHRIFTRMSYRLVEQL
jgi:lipopolysaccharide transport system permease protein